MSRRDALLRLHRALAARRDELRRRLGGERDELRRLQGSLKMGDSADLAFDSGSEEVTSQLAELESRELAQIDRALAQLKHGTYGLCELCQKKIPIARLNALPFSTTCVECQREIEVYGGYRGRNGSGNWANVADGDAGLEDQAKVDIANLELDLSK
jgi:DnaK suppressor protein